MDLWIRSQDKIVLMKVDEICYAEVYENEHTLWYRDIALGKYNSKERALEVLDEIQCHLVNINDSRDSYFYVYEMPVE